MTITTDNYEEYFYRYCEGELTEAERADVEAFARQHPNLAEELSLYDPAVKAEAPAEVFPDKESLLRHEPVRLPVWRWVAAACVAGLLLVGVWQFTARTPQQPVVAELSPKAKPAVQNDDSYRQPLPAEVKTDETPVAMSQPVVRIRGKADAEPLPPMIQHEALLDEPVLAEAMPTESQRTDAVEPTVIIYTEILLMPEEPVVVAVYDTVSNTSYFDDWLTAGRSAYDRLRARALRLEGDTRAMLASL